MISRIVLGIASVALVLGTSRVAVPGRFFFSGDGTLALEDAHNGAKLRVRFRRADGSYDPAALAQLMHFLRSRGDDRETDVSLRLIEQLDYLEDFARPKHLRLASGYRSPAYNNDIRARGGKAASASLHTQGLAADLQFDGVNIRRLWHRVRALNCCGVGYYKEGNFLHIDVGPPRFWEAATSKVDQNLSGGNARIFARTDFDRYPNLVGAVLRVHSVTAFPLRIAATATATAGDWSGVVQLAPDGDVTRDGDCLVVNGGDRPLLRVTSAPSPPKRQRLHLHLTTCEPRIERTPETFEANDVELTP